jgi:hypothetical protein
MYRMLTRKQVLSRRRWIAASVLLGVIFANIVTAVHACPLVATSGAAVVQVSVETAPPSCHDLAHKSNDNANVCQSHCHTGQQVDTQADAPIAAIAPREALTIYLVDLSEARARDASSLPALGAVAPLLRSSRLLI